MEVTAHQTPIQNANTRPAVGISSMLIVDGTPQASPELVPGARENTDVETLLALYLHTLHRLTQIDKFSIPIYILGPHNHCTVKTLCFVTGETIDETRTRVHTRLEVPGALLASGEHSEKAYPPKASFAACVHENSEPGDFLDSLSDTHTAGSHLATLVISGGRPTDSPAYQWITSFRGNNNSGEDSPYQACITYLNKLNAAYKENSQLNPYQINLLESQELNRQKNYATDIIDVVKHQPVFRQFESLAALKPESPAIATRKCALSYQQLNNLANLIAKKLLDRNVKPKDYVAVLLGTSVELFACIFAIHKVGAIYLPLDATFPDTRLKTILDAAPAAQLLHDIETSKIARRLDSSSLQVTGLRNKAMEELTPNPDIAVSLDAPSHIFFTSGTTGMPKGIAASHKNFAHSLYAGIRRYGFANSERFIAIARCTFSISMFEYFTALVLGASVSLVDRKTISNTSKLLDAVNSVSVVHMVPSLLRQILEQLSEAGEQKLPGINYLLTGGDMVPAELLEQARRALPNARIFVNYGSSEISCMGCTYEINRDQARLRTKIGKPHPNMKVRILDRFQNPVPIGLCGELYFSGDGVVPGYINRPDLNRKKFIDIEGERFFAIGDIGRFDTQGNIELLGREDFQVQINGIRIEPPEIESRIKQLDSVRDCVVVGRTLQAGKHASLVAYIVLNKTSIQAQKLTSYLHQYLPDYMCPSVYVRLSTLPTNHNGKIDRSLLPAPALENILSTEHSGESINALEQQLIEIWEQSFELDGLHPDHDFFEVGGTSLKAISMLSKVKTIFAKEIPLTQFLTNRSVRLLAQVISADEKPSGNENVTLLKPGNPDLPTLFCLNGSVQYRELATTIDIPNQVASVTLREEETVISDGAYSESFALISNFSHITQQYFNAITNFQPAGPYYLTGASFGGLIAFEVARRLIAEGEQIALIGLYDTWVPGFRDKAKPIQRIKIALRKIRLSGRDQIGDYVKRALNKLLRRTESKTSEPASGDIRDLLRRSALASYTLKPLMHEVVLFNAVDRPRYYGERAEEDLGWKRYTSNVDICRVPGDHIGILKYPNVMHLARKLESLFPNTTDSLPCTPDGECTGRKSNSGEYRE